MAIVISGFSVVVRNKTIEEKFPGGLRAYQDLCPNRTFCTDGAITRVSFAILVDAGAFVTALSERGLVPSDRGASKDVAVVGLPDSTLYPCDWLERGPVDERPAAWLAGSQPGELAIGDFERDSLAADTRIGVEELRESFDYLGTENGVETYRNRQSGKRLYIGRTTSLDSPIGREPRTLTPEELTEHDRAFQEAAKLTKGRILWSKRPGMGKPGWWARRKLRRAVSLLVRVQELNPAHWSAMWGIGKIYERLGDYSTAYSWFERAYHVDPYQVEVVKSACEAALQFGRHGEAIFFAHRAIAVKHGDFGLLANLALAFLVAGRLVEAKDAIDRAIAGDPTDRVSRAVQETVGYFITTGQKPPGTLNALQRCKTRRRPG